MKKFDTKSILMGIIVALVIASTVYAATATNIDVALNEIKVYIQKKGQEPQLLDNPNILYDGRTYVPLRAVSELFGNEVDYLSETHAAVIGTPTLPAYIDDFANNPYQQALIEQQRKEAEANTFKPKKIDGIPVSVTELEITLNGTKISYTNYSDYVINSLSFTLSDTRDGDNYYVMCWKTKPYQTETSDEIGYMNNGNLIYLGADEIANYTRIKEIDISYVDKDGGEHYIKYDIDTQKYTIAY